MYICFKHPVSLGKVHTTAIQSAYSMWPNCTVNCIRTVQEPFPKYYHIDRHHGKQCGFPCHAILCN